MNHATLSTHVLDLDTGTPAAALDVELYALAAERGPLAAALTDADGRIGSWPGVDALTPGTYALVFATGEWFARRGATAFHPRVRIEFVVTDDDCGHYHVPLLLARHGYSTYRGS